MHFFKRLMARGLAQGMSFGLWLAGIIGLAIAAPDFTFTNMATNLSVGQDLTADMWNSLVYRVNMAVKADAGGNFSVAWKGQSADTVYSDTGTTITTKNYVDGRTAWSKKSYTAVLSVRSASYCPTGWTLEDLSNYNRNGYIYMQITNNGLMLNAEASWNYGDEYLGMNYAFSNGPQYLCHRTFTTSGRPHFSIFRYGTDNPSFCPTAQGYHYLPHTQIKGNNDWGYFMSTDNGAYLGYIDSWPITSTTNTNGYNYTQWTSSEVQGTCFKVMGVDEDPQTKDGVYPVFLGVRNLATCTALGYAGMSNTSFGSSRYSYLQWNDASTTFGPFNSWGHGGENYAQVHYHDTHVVNTCWKYYPIQGRQPNIQTRLLASGSCPTGYMSIDPVELKGWDNNGYLQQTPYGMYAGGLYSWGRNSYRGWWITNNWTTQLSKVCIKID